MRNTRTEASCLPRRPRHSSQRDLEPLATLLGRGVVDVFAS